ncbi:MAG: hypothetical protein NT016_01290 [Candidatus Aenigmarchaeota archaeon]|nr:hypothetical protein [Candidatus Aenigmarchaeota archaeon]
MDAIDQGAKDRAYAEWLPKQDALSARYGKGSWVLSSKYDTPKGELHSFQLYEKDDGLLLVSTEGDEHLITSETMDRVRDICWGNVRSLGDADMRILEKYGDEHLLRYISEASVGNYIRKNFPEMAKPGASMGLFAMDMLLDFMADPTGKIERSEKDRQEKIKKSEELVKKLFGIDVKLKYPDGVLSQILAKGVSDVSFERGEFEKRIHFKKKDKDNEGHQ